MLFKKQSERLDTYKKVKVAGNFTLSVSGEYGDITPQELSKVVMSTVVELQTKINGTKLNGLFVSFDLEPATVPRVENVESGDIFVMGIDIVPNSPEKVQKEETKLIEGPKPVKEDTTPSKEKQGDVLDDVARTEGMVKIPKVKKIPKRSYKPRKKKG